MTPPRYSVLRQGKVYAVFDRKRRVVVAREPTADGAERIRRAKETADPITGANR